ncbi:uracil-DNA glycosylase, partial [archaeon]|nr:uracil-DNA glycosylase [archaeon]
MLPPQVKTLSEETSQYHSLDEVRSSIQVCSRCSLRTSARNIVFGEGNINADVMFIGEAPGAVEDETGRPFVGPAGELLTKIIESMGLKREDVYIANIIKCKTPDN